ncbi:hypothetical protein H6503_06055 [Candidatus Woesearchaeota archaeon]|nr:hypothetical protein [Candidatus Woesearchaeota archaeon]
MLKLKPIRPSLKEKKRYVVFKVIADSGQVKPESIFTAIEEKCLNFMGILSYSKAGLMILRNQFDTTLNMGIIRVSNKYVDHVKASLMMITLIDGKRSNVIVKGVSGILKKARDKFMKDN